MTSAINLKKFNIEKIKPTNSCNVIGPRNSGKTVLLKYILSYQNIRNGLVISESESEYEYTSHKYSPEFVDNLINSQKNKMSENLQNSNMVVIYEPSLQIGIKMKELVINNRHYAFNRIIITIKTCI